MTAMLRCLSIATMCFMAAAFTSPKGGAFRVLHANSSCPTGFKACGHCHCAPADACDACEGARVNNTISPKLADCPSDHVDCGNYTCVLRSRCPKGAEVKMSSSRSIQECPASYTNCGICKCVPKGVCGQCPNIIALSLSALDSYAEPSSSGESEETFANLSNESMSNFSEEAEPLPYPPPQDRIWSNTGSTYFVDWNRYTSAYPFLVSIKQVLFGRRYHSCGGTLIREDAVLTAAHCFYDALYNNYEVWWGHGDNEWVSSKVDLVVFPNTFTGKSTKFDDDIAVLRLPRRFVGAPLVKRSHLRTYQQFSVAQIVGWGNSQGPFQPGPDDANHLREGKKLIVGSWYCRDWEKDFKSNKKICSGKVGLLGAAGAGQGDSGGPMLLNGYQVGIVSHGIWSKANPKQNYLDVYTRVSTYNRWINDALAKYW